MPNLRAPEGDDRQVSKADTVKAPNVSSTRSERRGADLPESVGGGRFKLSKKLGEGSFGQVFKGYDTKKDRDVAIKLEHKKSSGAGQLGNESRLMDMLSRPERPNGFAELYHFGKEGSYAVLVMDLLGPTLEDSVAMCQGRLNAATAASATEQGIRLLSYVHSKCIVHRDIKSENFMWGTGPRAHHLYIIDFGMSTRYYLKGHVRLQHGKQLTGTARYASINAMRGLTQSRRDDLEALGHMIMYALRGSLPWSGLDAPTYKDKLKKICEKKADFPLDELCAGFPDEFKDFLKEHRELGFENRPDYDKWVSAFRAIRREKADPPVEDWDLQFLEGQDMDRDSLVPLTEGPCPPPPEESGGMAGTPSVRTEKSSSSKPDVAAE